MTPNKRFALLRKHLGMTQSEISNKINISVSKIQNFECGTQKVTVEILDNLLDYLMVNPVWIMQGRGDMFIDGKPNADNYDEAEFEANVKYFESIEDSAANGLDKHTTTQIILTIPRAYIRPRDPKKTHIVKLGDDSMLLSMPKDSLMLCDLGETSVNVGKVYIVRVLGEVSVKRIFELDGKLILKSDNPTALQRELEPSQVEIIARVFGVLEYKEI